MSKEKKLQVIDIFAFVLIMLITIMTLCDDKFSSMIDTFFLPEERNKAYYDSLNSPSRWFECKELSENGTENLLANYLSSGERDLGYSITVDADGSFIFSGDYYGENNSYEAIIPIDVGFNLPSGDYVLSDGGASLEDSIYVNLTGVKRLIGGGIEFITIASLPGNASFHWDNNPDIEICCDIVVCPGATADNLKFSPMLLKEDVAKREYQPCLAVNYDWEGNETENGVKFYKYDIFKGALDGELVTRDDWKLFLNNLRFQMQADRAVIDLKDGYGIEIRKKEYPMVIYGRLNASMKVSGEQTINITDYDKVVEVINFGLESSGFIDNDSEDKKRPKLESIRDFYSYLKALDEKDYTILLSVKDEGVVALNREIMELLRRLGMETNLVDYHDNSTTYRKYHQNSYCGVFRRGKADSEKVGSEKIFLAGTLSDGKRYTVESIGGWTEETNASIKIDGNEYAINLRGMNFVIYDEKQHLVIDSVCFDTHSGLLCHRQAK